eukprot:3390497-Rhodomonas_salina.3
MTTLSVTGRATAGGLRSRSDAAARSAGESSCEGTSEILLSNDHCPVQNGGASVWLAGKQFRFAIRVTRRDSDHSLFAATGPFSTTVALRLAQAQPDSGW